MAIYSAVAPPEEMPPPHHPSQASAQPQHIPQHFRSASGTIDIEAWTIAALESLSVSSPVAPGAGAGAAPLSIPLDDPSATNAARVTIAVDGDVAAATGITPPRRPPSRRDSMRRRELLLKGKEGSRQRRRWDMKRLTDVPNVEPPLDEDWEPRPVYPVRHIPYQVAAFWDRGLRQQVEDKGAAAAAARKKKAPGGPGGPGKVPRDLRETVRRSPGIKGWVRSLEEPVRQFLAGRGDASGGETDGFEEVGHEDESESDVSDDEVVFVGRKGGAAAAAAAARDRVPRPDGWKRAHREVHDRPIDRGMIFDSLEDDESGAFKRWLTHSISDYYGLDSRSVTMGEPARRCVYIGIREAELRMAPQIRTELPRPLWELF